MKLHICDPEVRRKAELLARIHNTTLTKAVGNALDAQLAQVERERRAPNNQTARDEQ
jgi:hypothetical protein